MTATLSSDALQNDIAVAIAREIARVIHEIIHS